jgi:methenyltetrahydromethanopterin cyclohydrolase
MYPQWFSDFQYLEHGKPTSPMHAYPLNRNAELLCRNAVQDSTRLRISPTELGCGAKLLDFGVNSRGGIAAGLLLARVCMADLSQVSLAPCDIGIGSYPLVQVTTDAPVLACMAAQYAGWPVQLEKFFAMGSGPMRSRRGKEDVLKGLAIKDLEPIAVGVLECDVLPNDAVCEMIAQECSVAPSELTLCIAPTRSIAGVIQVVARSIETSLHKLFELGFDLNHIVSAHGAAPSPPPAKDFAEGIGRTNDAILYGGRVTLWVHSDDEAIERVASLVPSGTSKDWGRPFAETFKDYGFDFYKVDPGLFSPAQIQIHNLKSGRSWSAGKLRPDVLEKSFLNQ